MGSAHRALRRRPGRPPRCRSSSSGRRAPPAARRSGPRPCGGGGAAPPGPRPHPLPRPRRGPAAARRPSWGRQALSPPGARRRSPRRPPAGRPAPSAAPPRPGGRPSRPCALAGAQLLSSRSRERGQSCLQQRQICTISAPTRRAEGWALARTGARFYSHDALAARRHPRRSCPRRVRRTAARLGTAATAGRGEA